jgi:hypothetical protein
MTIRYYVLPIERSTDGNGRGPKYFEWRRDPDPPGLTSPWSMIDYGLIDQAVLVSDITDPDRTSLVAQADVYEFPLDLDANMTQQQQSTLTTFLETKVIPAQWLSGTQTFRSVLRTITGVFLYIQRISGILGVDPMTISGVTLNTQYRNLPADFSAALSQAASDLDYDFSGVRNNTTLRNILKSMADQWGARPIYMGMATL